MHEHSELDELPEFWVQTILKLRSENHQLRKRHNNLRVAVAALKSLKNQRRFTELNAAIDDLNTVNSPPGPSRRERAPRLRTVKGVPPTTTAEREVVTPNTVAHRRPTIQE